MSYDHNATISTPESTETSPPPTNLTPYELNRPTPLPRGNRPINPSSTHGVPVLESIILHTMVKEAIGNKPALLTAIMAFRAISGETHLGGGRAGSSGVQILSSKSGAAAFKLRAGMPVAVKVELKGDAMYTFIQSLVDFVLPRIRDFPGFPLSPSSASKKSPSATGGVVALGLPPAAMALFPQIEANLDAYPRTHGMHMQFLTSAKGDRAQDKARALLSGFRIPFARR
jgi:large subunit ribosomal protein L5